MKLSVDVEGDVVLADKRTVGRKVKESAAVVPVKRYAVAATVALSLVFLLLSAAYNALTPAVTPAPLHVFDGGAPNPDEIAHRLYVQSLASGSLPVFSNTSPDYEAHQPPAYYAIAAIFDKISNNIHVVRLASTLLGVVLIWAVFVTVRDQFPDRDDIVVGSTTLVTLLPMNITLSSSVSNDTASNIVFVLFLLVLGRLLRGKLDGAQCAVWLALVFGLGIWTKSSTLVLIPTAIVALGLAAWKKALPLKSALTAGVGGVLGGALIGAPWLLRNQHLYGDPFASHVVFHVLAVRNHSPGSLISYFGLGWYVERFFVWTFDSYWGVFDSMNLYLPEGVYFVLGLATVVTIVTGIVSLAMDRSTSASRSLYFLWSLLTLAVFIAYIQYNIHFFQLQGRYLYPALLPLSVASASGISALVPKKYWGWAGFALAGGLIVLNLLCLTIISGRYAT